MAVKSLYFSTSGPYLPGSAPAAWLSLNLQFKTGFLGQKIIYAMAVDKQGAASEWRGLGQWRSADIPSGRASSETNSGSAARFWFMWNHMPGGSPIRQAWIIMGEKVDWKDSCGISYEAAPDRIALSLGSNENWTQQVPVASAKGLRSPFCSVLSAVVSVDRKAGRFLLDMTLAFSEVFLGEKKIWLQAINEDGQVSAWQDVGRFTVTGSNAAPEVLSVRLAEQDQRKAVVEVEIRDANGTRDIKTVDVVVNDRNEFADACALEIKPLYKQIGLRSNSGLHLIGSIGFDSSSVVENAQCRVQGSGSSMIAAGDILRIRLVMELKGVMAGEQRIFVKALDLSEKDSAWAESVPFTVPPDPGSRPPRINASGMIPKSSASLSLLLDAQDPDGGRDVSFVDLLIGSSPGDAEPCWLRYNRRSRRLELRSEDNTEWLQAEPTTFGLEHARCWIPADVRPPSPEAPSVQIAMGAAFRGMFSGAKSVWARASDASGFDSGWQKLGDFTVLVPQDNRAPVSGAATPISGTGAAAAISFPATDPDGPLDFRTLVLQIQALKGTDRWCMVVYQRITAAFLLASDDAPRWQVFPSTGAPVGSGRCRLLRTALFGFGNELAPKAWVAFDESMAGPLRFFQQTFDVAGAESGWHEAGQWVATFPNQAPSGLRIDPVTGQGNEQVFEFSVQDPDGAQDLERVEVTISRDGNATNSCRYFVEPNSGWWGLNMENGHSFFATIIPIIGANVTFANGQCSLQFNRDDVRLEGGLLKIRAPVQFLAGLSGPNVIRVMARDLLGATLTLENAGSWTVPEPEPNHPPETVMLERVPTGAQERWKATFRDPDGYGHLATVDLRVGNSAPYCGLRYDRQRHTVQLLSDDGNSWGNAVSAISGVKVENAACEVVPSSMWITGSGLTMNLEVNVRFRQPTPSDVSVWMAAKDRAGAATDWVRK